MSKAHTEILVTSVDIITNCLDIISYMSFDARFQRLLWLHQNTAHQRDLSSGWAAAADRTPRRRVAAGEVIISADIMSDYVNINVIICLSCCFQRLISVKITKLQLCPTNDDNNVVIMYF